jgi:iron complex outermembrane receptor protein
MTNALKSVRRCVLLCACAVGGLSASPALAQGQKFADLGDMTLEQLGKLQVTSVSKTAEPVSAAPASIFVITNADLESSGALTLTEALRLAPNLQVARLDDLSTVITARGFNSFETANKMLVLIDGRSVYSPLFSGVFWDAQNVMLEDLDRIEVVSGPGGTLWGANAVNGVINVISRDSHETQGGLLHAAAGDRERYLSARYGGSLGGTGAFRVYAMGFQRDDALDPPGVEEGFEGFQAGFRTDFGDASDTVTLQGDLYDHESEAESALATAGSKLRGGNLLGRWTHDFDSGASFQLQTYYDRVVRSSDRLLSQIDTYDAQAQLNWRRGAHEIVAGAGYRATYDRFDNDLNPFVTDPEARWISLADVFVQDEVALRPDLHLIAGLKLEHSSYTGAELLPNVRIAWTPSDKAMVWAAASRAVRTPSRIERDLIAPGVVANGFFDSEHLWAYEAGYRGQPFPRTSLSVSVFYNVYDDLRTNELIPGAQAGEPFIFVGNGLTARTYGVEAWGGYDVLPWWRLSAGVSALHKDLELKPGVVDFAGMAAGGNDPSFQVIARSQMSLGERVKLDLRLRAVDDLPSPPVPAYIEADASVSWRLTDAVSLSLTGRNLLHEGHLETVGTGMPDTYREAARSVYAGLRWSF